MMDRVSSADDAGRRRPRTTARESGPPQSWVVSAVLGAAMVVALVVLQVSGLLDEVADVAGRSMIYWIAVVAGILVVVVAFAWERQVD